MRWFLIPLALIVLSGCGPRLRLTPEATKQARVEAEDKTVADIIKERNYHLGEVAKRDVQLKQKSKDAIRAKCYWVAGIATLALFACVAAAIFLSGFRKYAVLGAVASVAVAALALFVAAIVDYLIIIGGIVLGVLVVAAVLYWRMDQASRDQVVQGFAELKPKLGNSYKAVMQKYVTPTSNKLIDSTRARLGVD